LDRIGMVVVEGAALHFERTLDLDGTVHADEASEQDVRDMFAALVAVPTASVAAGERR
jgi:hypothetical protein